MSKFKLLTAGLLDYTLISEIHITILISLNILRKTNKQKYITKNITSGRTIAQNGISVCVCVCVAWKTLHYGEKMSPL